MTKKLRHSPVQVPMDLFVEKDKIKKAYKRYRKDYPEGHDIILYSRYLSINHPLGLRLFVPYLELSELERKRFFYHLYKEYALRAEGRGKTDAFLKLALEFLRRMESGLPREIDELPDA